LQIQIYLNTALSASEKPADKDTHVKCLGKEKGREYLKSLPEIFRKLGKITVYFLRINKPPRPKRTIVIGSGMMVNSILSIVGE